MYLYVDLNQDKIYQKDCDQPVNDPRLLTELKILFGEPYCLYEFRKKENCILLYHDCEKKGVC